jgi:hypothetical protein
MEKDKCKLSMKRLLARRDVMRQILSSPHPSEQMIPRGILDGDVSQLSTCELASLLSAIADEIGAVDAVAAGSAEPIRDATSSARAGRKRPRSEVNNNHAILRFVERVACERLSSFENEYDDFIDKELKSYTDLHDASFRAEEDILCLIFLISIHTIQCCLVKQNPMIGDSLHQKSIPYCIPLNAVVETAIRVVDTIVTVSKRERVARGSCDSIKPDTAQMMSMSKRQRYQHLLQDEQTLRKKALQEHEAMVTNTPSVVEEKYPNQWEWLNCLRRKYSEKGEAKWHTSEPIRDTGHSNEQTIIEAGDLSDDANSALEDEVLRSRESSQKERIFDSDGKNSPLNIRETAIGDSGVTIDNREVNNVDSPVKDDNPTTIAMSPLDELDIKAYELRKTLINMPPTDLSHAIGHVTESIVLLLRQYGDLDGASGIQRCGDVVNGAKRPQHLDSHSLQEVGFHLSETLVSAVTNEFLTDATGALRAKAFLRSFILPLMLEMNPGIAPEQSSLTNGKPASRLMTFLLTSLARDRPMECVESVLIPTLMSGSSGSQIEPNRFQCELVARLLKGKDALSEPAIALLLEKLLPSNDPSVSREYMIWTEHSMPLVSGCLNRQPELSDATVAVLADQVEHYLSATAPVFMQKSMKLSTVFHVLVSKYGDQVKASNKVEPLKEAAGHLKTFMSKTISTVLGKLSLG